MVLLVDGSLLLICSNRTLQICLNTCEISWDLFCLGHVCRFSYSFPASTIPQPFLLVYYKIIQSTHFTPFIWTVGKTNDDKGKKVTGHKILSPSPPLGSSSGTYYWITTIDVLTSIIPPLKYHHQETTPNGFNFNLEAVYEHLQTQSFRSISTRF